MALLSIKFTADGVCHGEPYKFTPAPLEPNDILDADVAIYRGLCRQLGLPPSSPMLLLAGGDEPRQLFLRRAETVDAWNAFKDIFFERAPNMRIMMAVAQAAVTVIPIGYQGRSVLRVPEIVVGWEMLRAFGPKFGIVRDDPLPGAPRRRCDFSIRAPDGRCLVRIEIAGMLDRQGQPCTLDGHAYMARQPARAQAYQLAGLPPPVIVYAGELFGVRRRRQLMTRILAAIALSPV
jgi:hypothetical protein